MRIACRVSRVVWSNGAPLLGACLYEHSHIHTSGKMAPHMEMHSVDGPTPPHPLKQRSGSMSNLLSRVLPAKSNSGKRLLSWASSGKIAAPPIIMRGTSQGSSAPAIEALASDLAKLSSSPHTSCSLMQLGFIAPLINMAAAAEESEAVQLHACRAIAHLASHRENAAQIIEAGALSALLPQLEAASSAIKLGALEALRPLSRDPSAKGTLRGAAPTKLIIKLIGEGCAAEATADAKAVAEAAIGVLRNISASAASQDVLKSAGAIRILVGALDALPVASHPTAAARVATTLSNMAVGHQANKTSVRKAGAIPKLVALLHSGEGEASAAAVEALGNLAVKNAENKDATRDAGGVRALSELYREATGCSAGRKATPRASSAGTTPASSRGSSRPASRPHSRPPSPRPSARGTGGSEADDEARSAGAQAQLPSSAATQPSSTAVNSAMPALVAGGSSTQSPAGTPPGTPRDATEPAVERVRWALRNLCAANGLNTAVLVACGVPLTELDGSISGFNDGKGKARSSVGQPEPAEPAAKPPPPPKPPTTELATGTSEGAEEDAHAAAEDGKSFVGVGLTMWSKTGRAF